MVAYGDVGPLLDLSRVAAGGADLNVVRLLAVEALHALVASDMVLWGDIDHAAGKPGRCVSTPSAIDDDILQAFVAHVAEHPLGVLGARAPAVLRISDVLADREFRSTELHRTFYAPLRMQRQICIDLPAPPGHTVGIALHRAQRDFSDDECGLLERVAPALACAVIAASRPRRDPRLDTLTARESQVLSTVAAGYSDQQVARLLGMSRRTVGKHLEHIYGKFGVSGRTAAAAIARDVCQTAPPGSDDGHSVESEVAG